MKKGSDFTEAQQLAGWSKRPRHGSKMWLRQHRLSTGSGKHLYILKRAYPTDCCCELCEKKIKRLNYHHWGEVNLGEDVLVCGMWLCNVCHSYVHRTEDGYAIKYTKLKEKIENDKVQQNH